MLTFCGGWSSKFLTRLVNKDYEEAASVGMVFVVRYRPTTNSGNFSQVIEIADFFQGYFTAHHTADICHHRGLIGRYSVVTAIKTQRWNCVSATFPWWSVRIQNLEAL